MLGAIRTTIFDRRDFAVFVHLLKSAVGSGILFLPHAVRRTGYVMSIAGGVVVGIVATHTAVLLVRCAVTLCKRNRVPTLDFAETAEISFKTGPAGIRKYARKFAVVTNVIVCFVQLQACVIYELYGATSFQQVIEFFSGTELDVRVYIVVLFPCACLLGLVPNLKYLAPFSVIGTLFLFVGLIITMSYVLDDFPDPGRLSAFTDVLSVPMYCSIFLFALHNMTLYLPLQNSMKNPERMPRLIMISMIVNVVAYVTFGFLGYNKYANACDTVIKNLPLNQTLAQVVKITIALSVLFTFGLAYYVPISIIWPMIRDRFNGADRRYEILFRLAGVTATTILAIAVPQMVPLLGLFAAVSVTSMMLLIPVMIETATYWSEATVFMHVKNALIVVLYVFILIFGAVESTWSIISEYGGEREEGC